ncbi:MAG TPA: alpha/beta hydrolase [Gaiellaceae bacterium]|jgi:proline iminopeptidase|nr:alpha/beta hydrolase [Gaiellaceae bacterium]
MEGLTTRDGRRLAYRRIGEGPTLVCHGGGPGFSSFYLADLAGLGEELGLVLLDPRGTGESTKPRDARAYEIEDYVADLEELREHLGVERLQLLGHSHGGIVAIAYAARYPGRIERLILASTLARFSPEQESAMEEAVARQSDEPWYEDAHAALEAEAAGDFESDEELAELALREFPFYFARYGDDERAYLETLRSERPNADALRLFNKELVPVFDLRHDLTRITAPTLVIAGENDFITGPPSAAELGEGIANAKTVLLPGTGHFVFVEAPGAFREAVLAFLGVGLRA